MNYIGLDDFRERLLSAGWRVSPYHAGQFNLCNWYAWSTDRDGITPDCACNDKPPSLIVYPAQIELAENLHTSVEVVICGETKSGEWLNLRAYSIKPEEFFERYASIRARLVAAWRAGAE